jgi:arabinofuranosyltransferase
MIASFKSLSKVNQNSRHNLLVWIILGVLIVAFAILVTRRAWLSDDAYITFRTVDNLVNGYKFTWNTIERVQAYTHPFWMLVLSAANFLSGEMFFTSIYLSVVISVVGVSILSLRIANTSPTAIMSVVVLSLSSAFVDYSTSGLENPLTHFLMVLFALIYFNGRSDLKTFFWLSLIVSLAGFNRLDTILFYIPALLLRLWQIRGWRAVLVGAIGQTPLILWELCSLIYYGFLFPNTYYAKLNTGIPAGELAIQGLNYFVNSFLHDPLTLLIIFAALIVSMISRKPTILPLAIGIVLYLSYVVKIGGGFMSGRFFTAPLLMAVIILVRIAKVQHRYKTIIALGVAAVIIGLTAPEAPFRLSGQPGTPIVDAHGISDERLWYFNDLGLINAIKTSDPPVSLGRERGEQARNDANNDLYVIAINNTGIYGYYAGPSVYIVDNYALSDPLLARLPAERVVNWRSGHFKRALPDGYIARIYGLGELGDPQLALFYDRLELIVGGKLFDPERWSAILDFNLGRMDSLINYDIYRYPDMVFTNSTALNSLDDPAVVTDANSDGNDMISFSDSGLEIDLEGVFHADRIGLCLDSDDSYQVEYWDQDQKLASDEKPVSEGATGLICYFLDVPQKANRPGYSRMRVFPTAGDGNYKVGHIRLVESDN